MQLPQPFDARGVEPASFAPPPPLADYHVRIVESEFKPVKDTPNAGFLELTMEILDPGPYAGRKIPYRLNMIHPNAQTVDIAYRQLSAVCHVTGQFQIQDSRQLHNIPFVATIGPQANNPQYANVFAVKDINGVVPGKAGATQAAPAPAQAPPAAAAPWGAPPPAAAPAAPWGAPAPAAPAAAAAAAPAWGPPPVAQAPPAAAPAPAWTPSPAAAPAAQPGAPWGPTAPPAAKPPWA